MSDIIELWEKCVHDRLESHPLPEAEPTMLLGLAGMAYAEKDLCPGGKLRRFRTRWEGLTGEISLVEVTDDDDLEQD